VLAKHLLISGKHRKGSGPETDSWRPARAG